MKELNQFTSWADSVSNSYLTEFVAPEKKKSSRAMNNGIQSIAQRQYPDLSPEEALITYMGQKLTDMEAKDAEQIKLINRQSQETNKLMNTVQGIRAAYDQLERNSQEVEQELDQIRGGAERAKSGQEQNTISAREVKELLNTVEELKKNPNVDKSEYRELVDSVKNMKDSNVSKEQYEALKQQIEQARSDENPELSSIHADIEKLKQEYGEKVAGAGKLRDELKALLKNDPEVLKNNPFIDELDVNINNVIDRVNQTNNKLENLPNKEELAALKNVPTEIEQLNQWANSTAELDKQQNQQIEDVKDTTRSTNNFVNFLKTVDDRRTQTALDLANHILELEQKIQKITGEKIDHGTTQDYINALDHARDERRRKNREKWIAAGRRQPSTRVIRQSDRRELSTDISLPKTYQREIDTLAERILGEQYGKYLK